MKRVELEHVIRAAGSIADAERLVIIGSQAILGSFANPPEELTKSVEADTYPLGAPEKADLIDGSIGEGSPFHEMKPPFSRPTGKAGGSWSKTRTRAVRLGSA